MNVCDVRLDEEGELQKQHFAVVSNVCEKRLFYTFVCSRFPFVYFLLSYYYCRELNDATVAVSKYSRTYLVRSVRLWFCHDMNVMCMADELL